MLDINSREKAGQAMAVWGAGISPFNPNITSLLPSETPIGLQSLDGLVNQQALMISDLDDFKLMMMITLCALPLAWILKKHMTDGPAPQMAHD